MIQIVELYQLAHKYTSKPYDKQNSLNHWTMMVGSLISNFLMMALTVARASKFPPDFKFGVATASYQVEGGWNASGKGENIWDRLTHAHPELIRDHSTGDIACDSYHRWQEDVAILKDLGVDFYRFSLSWSRLLPTGFPNKINQDGINYYNHLIDALIANKIEPMVTLYHWDLPQPLQDIGGWPNSQIARYFANYARVAFQLFGDRVKIWITINEPNSICEMVYGDNAGAPNVKSPGIGDYLCGKGILLGHALAYHVYDTEFRREQKGIIGITIDSIWAEPKTNSSADINAAERELQMSLGWWAHPIFTPTGGYPVVMSERIETMSRAEGFAESRLPPLTDAEATLVRDTSDFLGLNHYRTLAISDCRYPVTDPPSYQKDKATAATDTPKISAWGFRKLINWVKRQYGNPLVFITENGYGDHGDGLKDNDRVLFLKEYMTAVLQATLEDGCNVKRYTVWSVMDNMEWRAGYSVKFGIYQVDFSSPNRTRTPKASASFYKSVIKARRIPQKNHHKNHKNYYTI